MQHRESTIKLGVNRNQPRIWLSGKWLTQFGFAPETKFTVTMTKGKVQIEVDANGNRTVSAKGEAGIIDINSAQLTDCFAPGSTLHVSAGSKCITITPAKSIIKAAARILTLAAASFFAGGGLADAAIGQAGFRTVAAVEVDESFANVWELNHSGSMYQMPIEEVDFLSMKERIGGPLGLLVAGRPCEPYSSIRTMNKDGTKRDKRLPPEAHDLGHLDYYMLAGIDHLNPHTVIVENVPEYLDSGSGYIVQGVLRAMRYNVEARILNSAEYGALTARRRAYIVASMNPIAWPQPVPLTRTAGEILENIPEDDPCWFGEGHWAVKHWAAQTAKGNGFAAPAIHANSPFFPTLKKRYYAGQGDNFVIAHPSKPNTYRWLTLTEGRRLMGLPENYDLGPTKTTAGEILGQGVVVSTLQQLIAANCPLNAVLQAA